MTNKTVTFDARFYLAAALDWIDAIPADLVDKLPAMPGFDRDGAEAALDTAPTPAEQNVGQEAVGFQARCFLGDDLGGWSAWEHCSPQFAAQVRDKKADWEVRPLYAAPVNGGEHGHASDCAVHNMPAYPNGPCDCEISKDAERYRWLRDTLHGAKAGGGVEVNNALQVYKEPTPGEEVSIYWYPDSAVGSCELHGSTLCEVIDRAIAIENDHEE